MNLGLIDTFRMSKNGNLTTLKEVIYDTIPSKPKFV